MSKQHLLGEEDYSFDYHFTEDELEGFAEVMAGKCQLLEQLESRKSAQAKAFKEEIDAEQFALRTAAYKHRNKKERRFEPCHKIADYERGEIVYRDISTGVERGSRPMTAEEKQIPLTFLPPPKPPVPAHGAAASMQ